MSEGGGALQVVATPAADWVRIKLEDWANSMWQRFGGEGVAVYLAGSSLTSDNPRDVDIAIVLPDSHFRLRYGGFDVDWERGSWPKSKRLMAREVGGLVPHLCACLTNMRPPDLKVLSQSAQDQWYKDHPKLRLDTMEVPGLEA